MGEKGNKGSSLRSLEERLKATEEALRASEEKCQRIVDTAYEGIPVVDEDFRYTFVNKRMAEMFGYEPEEMLGKRLEDFVFEEDLPSLLERKARHKQGIAEQLECRYRRKDGGILWVLVSTNPVIDADGRFRGVFSAHMDISELKVTVEALRAHDRRDHTAGGNLRLCGEEHHGRAVQHHLQRVLPFLLSLCAAAWLLFIFPQIATWLPDLFMGK